MHTITKRFDFEAAHVLPWHPGKCKRLHGHSYKLEVDVTGNLDENGIVADFTDLKELVKNEVVDKYDHQNLNDYFGNPTAEVMAQKFFEILSVKWHRYSEYARTFMILPVGEKVKFHSGRESGEGYVSGYTPMISKQANLSNPFPVRRIEPLPESGIRRILRAAGIIKKTDECPTTGGRPLDDGKAWPSKGLRRFLLIRDDDKTGLSGTGVVAEGIEFSDGSCAMRWLTPVGSTTFYPSIKAVEYIHGHGGATRAVYAD